MKNVLVSCMAGVSLLLASCTPSAVDTLPKAGYGNVSFGVKAKTEFTRAVNEADYANTAEYTVEIWNSEGSRVYNKLYKDLPNSINLANGNYTLKAFYGTEEVASRETFYVFGEKNFVINADNQTLEVDCYPTCGRVKTYFDKTMADYFSSYSVVYETQALTEAGETAAWSSSDTEPWYLKLAQNGEVVKATIHLTRTSDGKSTPITREYAMTPGQSWTLNIAPKNDNGVLSGIIITVDENTEDIEKDVIVPSDWI